LHPALGHVDQDRTKFQKLTRFASMEILHQAITKKEARKKSERGVPDVPKRPATPPKWLD